MHAWAMSTKQLVCGMPIIDLVEKYCNGCTLGKQHHAPFPQATAYRAEYGPELVHTQLCGPITPMTPGGNKYILLVMDDYGRYMWLGPLKSKDEAFERFIDRENPYLILS